MILGACYAHLLEIDCQHQTSREAGNTLTVWLGHPQDEYVDEKTGDEVVLMKDQAGKGIGFEKLNFSITKPKHLQVAFETIAA